MNPNLPVCCSRTAFDLMLSLRPRLDEPESLLPAAVGLSLHACPDASVERCLSHIDRMAAAAVSEVKSGSAQARLAHLHAFLFDDLGFEGNSEDYYAPENSLLPRVLDSKRGLPITLSLIYKEVAGRIGLKAWGVGLPGHFVAAVETHGKPMLIDAFAGGRVLSIEEAKSRVSTQFPDQVEWSEKMLEPVSNRYWITRILQNMLAAYSRKNDHAAMAAVLELELLLWPDEARLQRDLAMVLARVGKQDVASVWLEHYLQNNPDDPRRDDLRQILSKLG